MGCVQTFPSVKMSEGAKKKPITGESIPGGWLLHFDVARQNRSKKSSIFNKIKQNNITFYKSSMQVTEKYERGYKK